MGLWNGVVLFLGGVVWMVLVMFVVGRVLNAGK